MATRQEDLKTIQTIYDALSYMEELKKKIEEEKEKIQRQQSRKIEDYPEYVPANFKKEAEEQIKAAHEKKKRICVFAIGIVFKLLAIAFSIYRITSGAFAFVEQDTLYAAILFWVGPALAALIIILPVERLTAKINIFGRLGILCAIDIVAGLLFMWMGFTGKDMGFCLFWSETSFAGAIAAGCTLAAGGLTCMLLSHVARKKQKKILAHAERKDAEHLAKYEQSKAEREIVIAQQKAALAAEVTSKIAEIQARIESYLQEFKKQQQIVAKTPGLAREDKNLYTVSIILRYFERYKVDSIKEAVNLFDMEERQNEAARAAARQAVAINSWIKTQQDTLEEMEANQRRHNEKMEEEARRLRERINEELNQQS